MFSVVRHECGALAQLVGQSPVVGWNLYCCYRCGDAYFKWFTQEMIDQVWMDECS